MVMNARAPLKKTRSVHCIWSTLKHEMCVYGSLLIVQSIVTIASFCCIFKNSYGYSVKMKKERNKIKLEKTATKEKQATDSETCIDNAFDQNLESSCLRPSFIFTFATIIPTRAYTLKHVYGMIFKRIS